MASAWDSIGIGGNTGQWKIAAAIYRYSLERSGNSAFCFKFLPLFLHSLITDHKIAYQSLGINTIIPPSRNYGCGEIKLPTLSNFDEGMPRKKKEREREREGENRGNLLCDWDRREKEVCATDKTFGLSKQK